VAKVKNPLGSSEARGAVGEFVYGTWRGISVVRTKVTPEAKPPGLREAAQAVLAEAAAAWSTIDPESRQRWYDYAAQHVAPDWTGTDLRLPAYNCFIRTWVTRSIDSWVPSEYPPIDACLCDITDLIAYPTPPIGNVDYTWYGPDDHHNYGVQIWSTNPHSAGRNPTLHDAHRCGVVKGGATSADVPIGAGEIRTAFLRVVHSTGQIGNWHSIRLEAI
jgi:hypothetical protein